MRKRTMYIGDTMILCTVLDEGPDTKVEVHPENETRGNRICWINWDDKEKFAEELNQVINKYRI